MTVAQPTQAGSAHRKKALGRFADASRLPIENRYEVIGDPALANANFDRIIHNSYRIELNGESMRKLKAVNTEPDARKPVKEAQQNVTTSASTPVKVRRK